MYLILSCTTHLSHHRFFFFFFSLSLSLFPKRDSRAAVSLVG